MAAKKAKKSVQIPREPVRPDPPKSQRKKPIIILLVLGLLCIGVSSFFLLEHHSTGAQTAAAETADTGYVDSAECASCHQEIAATYAKNGMGRSFSKPTAANAVEDYTHSNTFAHAASGMNYRMIARNGEYFQRRSQAGPGGEINAKEDRVDYIIGSGNHSRTYLHRAPDGQLIELPVSWYSEGHGYWAMSPGYDRKDQADFGRAINSECMFCHNSYPQLDAQAQAALDRSIFPATLPEGIDCQRCHGPGRAHVEAARAPHPSDKLVSSTIVNPAHLSRDRQLEVCMQCHLETSVHEPNEQRLFNRAIFSFRPGESIADYKIFTEPSTAKPDAFEIAHAAYRLRKSACFLNSQMTCLTCHDPHDIPHGAEAVAHYTEVCLNCHRNVAHTVALPASSSCISCHMPKRRTDDTVHVVMTDHWIRRTQPTRDLLAPLAETSLPAGAVAKATLYYPAKLPATPAAEIALAEAQVHDHGIEHLQSLLEKYQPNAPGPYLTLAEAYQREGNDAQVAYWSQQALLKRPDYRPAIVELIPALFASNQDAAATTALEQAVGHYPSDDLLLSDLGNAYERQGQTAQALDALHRAVAANPDRTESHNLLGAIALKQGDAATADREFREALRCQPGNSEANANLAALLMQSQHYPEAAFYFDRAIAADPENIQAHRYLARLLALMNQIPRSIAEFHAASALAPDDPQIHQDLGDVLLSSKRPTEAQPEYERVLLLTPQQPHAQLGLAMSLLSQHKIDQARPLLESVAHGADPATAQTAQGILAQLPH
jgi:Flp pilus assembly protein TadD